MLFSLFTQLSSALATDLASYWGQASAGNQQSLSDYCTSSPGDIYIISFINSFGSGNQISVNVAGYNNYFPGTQLSNAPELGEEIQKCQSLGKKVLISMGGASGNYGFSSPRDAEKVAQDVWDYFAGGSSDTRPFGDAKVDGFDSDGENNVSPQNYVPFVNKSRQLYATDNSKQYYVSAAPQCPFPDATNGAAIAQADVDYSFVQFYNNYCALTGNNFNFDTWQNFASSSSPNKDVKIFVGLAGSPSAAGSGYVTIDELKAKRAEFENEKNFGGFMVWDASQANSNIVNGKSYAEESKEFDGESSSPAPAPTTSSKPAPQPTTTSPVVPPVPKATSSYGNNKDTTVDDANNGAANTYNPGNIKTVEGLPAIPTFVGANKEAHESQELVFTTATANTTAAATLITTTSPNGIDATTTVWEEFTHRITSGCTSTITQEPEVAAATPTTASPATVTPTDTPTVTPVSTTATPVTTTVTPVPTTSTTSTTSAPAPVVSTSTSTGEQSSTTSAGVVIVYETVWETEYTTKYNCATQTVTAY